MRLAGGDFVGFSGHSSIAVFDLESASDISERRRFSSFIDMKAEGSGRGRGTVNDPMIGERDSGLGGVEERGGSGKSIRGWTAVKEEEEEAIYRYEDDFLQLKVSKMGCIKTKQIPSQRKKKKRPPRTIQGV